MVSTGGKKETPVCPHIWDNEAVIWTMAVGLLLSTLVYLEHLYSGQEWIGDDAAEPEQAAAKSSKPKGKASSAGSSATNYK